MIEESLDRRFGLGAPQSVEVIDDDERPTASPPVEVFDCLVDGGPSTGEAEGTGQGSFEVGDGGGGRRVGRLGAVPGDGHAALGRELRHEGRLT